MMITKYAVALLFLLYPGSVHADSACYAKCYAIAKPCNGRAECNTKSNGCYDRCDLAPAPLGPPPVVASTDSIATIGAGLRMIRSAVLRKTSALSSAMSCSSAMSALPSDSPAR